MSTLANAIRGAVRKYCSECMRLVCAFQRTAADRVAVAPPDTRDGCVDPAQPLAPTAAEPEFAHIRSEFEARIVRTYLGDISCVVVPQPVLTTLSVSSALGVGLHEDDVADGGSDLGAAPVVLLRDPITSVSAVGAAGTLFCYVAKLGDGSRWCRVFRCADGRAVRTVAEAAVKDALLTARYNTHLAEHDHANAGLQRRELEATQAQALLAEGTAISGNLDRIRRRLQEPYLFVPDGDATLKYDPPPRFTAEATDAFAVPPGELPAAYDVVPSFDPADDAEETLAEAHAANCRRAAQHTPPTSKASATVDPKQTTAATTAVAAVVTPTDAAAEHAQLLRAHGLANQTVRMTIDDGERECGCGYGYTCKACRLRKADEEEVFEGFPDEVYEKGFGPDEEEEYTYEIYVHDNGDSDDDDADMPFSSFRCGCGIPYEEFCRTCDFRARKALADTPLADGGASALDASVYEESSFMDADGVDARRAAVAEGAEAQAADESEMGSVDVWRGSAQESTVGEASGEVGFLDEPACVDLLAYAPPGNYLIRRLDSVWYCIMVRAPSVDKPVVKIPVRTLEDGRYDCGARLFYRMTDVLDSLRKRPLKTAAANKDWNADLWLKAPVRTNLYVDDPLKGKQRRPSLARRLSSWIWRS